MTAPEVPLQVALGLPGGGRVGLAVVALGGSVTWQDAYNLAAALSYAGTLAALDEGVPLSAVKAQVDQAGAAAREMFAAEIREAGL